VSKDVRAIIEGERFPIALGLRATLVKLLMIVFRVRVLNEERVPAGGAILAGNHVSYMDPILLWCASPRRCRFMSKSELWERGPVAWLLPRLWSFPVDRGQADRTAISTATKFLTAGELVGIFPEGGPAQGGTAFIAMRAGAAVVPVAFVGTDKVWPRGQRLPRFAPVTIAYGEPIDPSCVAPEAGRKERVEALTTEIMSRIDELVERTKEVAR
jgi:1-acyl-sn-glycerol-3-phosphate acyltransferase